MTTITTETRPRIAPIDAEQHHRMLEAGILESGAPIELLDGVLVYKERSTAGADPMTISPSHRLGVLKLAALGPALEVPAGHRLLSCGHAGRQSLPRRGTPRVTIGKRSNAR